MYSITCLKTCHFTACFMSLSTSISVPISILHLTSSRFWICLLISITLLTHFHTHTQRHTHTHNHTCMISTQEEWRQLGTVAGALLEGAKKKTVDHRRDWQMPCTHTQVQNNIYKNVKKITNHKNVSKPRSQTWTRFKHTEFSTKLLDYSLRGIKATSINENPVTS